MAHPPDRDLISAASMKPQAILGGFARSFGVRTAWFRFLGLQSVEDLGWQTDVLGDARRVALRERIIHAIRRPQADGLMSFDPKAMFYEDNLDHKVLAEAVDEAFWTAMFDKHHPEHFAEGLAPHGCVKRWYFGRSVPAVTHVFDTGGVIDTQIRQRQTAGMRSSHWKWHLEEVFVKIDRERHYLRRAVEREGEVLASFVTKPPTRRQY